MSPFLTVIVVLLVVMAIPPIVSAMVLWSYRHSDSWALRERWFMSLVLAVQALVVAGLALNRLLSLGFSGEVLTIPLASVLMLVDVASLRWLWQWWTGRLVQERDWPETDIEQQDRLVGDERRRLQSEADENET